MNRRTFLKGAALTAVALRTAELTRQPVNASPFSPAEAAAMANHLLTQVNVERADAGLLPLKLDPLACSVAQTHATEMARHNFLSHWGLDGRKPYHRYSFAGGVEAIQENGGALNTATPVASTEAPIYLMSLHRSMYEEAPPNDGHRKTILNPHNTHVGFGCANYGFSVRLCELYVSRYVAIDPYAATGPPQRKFVLSGRLLETVNSLESIDVFYEPLPAPPEMSWLRVSGPYGLPDDRETLLPKLGSNWFYQDGSKGSIELLSGSRFKVPIVLSRKQPGIYTIVVWVKRSVGDAVFPATHVCVRAE